MNFITTALKRVFQLLFNRIFYVALALFIQLGWIFLTVWRLTAYSRYFSIALDILTVIMALWIVNRKINPSYKLAWTILILMVPIFGLVIYLLFGQSRIANRMEERFQDLEKEGKAYMNPLEDTLQKLEKEDLSI